MALFGKVIKRGIAIGDKIDNVIEKIPPQQHQKRVLRRLVRRAVHTSFGQYYDFKDLLRDPEIIADFQAKVPIFDYNDMHDKWWHLSLNNVENVSWRGKIKYFALSSGTSGAPSKYIPVSVEMMRAMRKAGLKMFLSLSKFNIDPDLFSKGMMMLGGTSSLKDQGGYFAGDLSGINAGNPPFWLRPYYKPGTKISKIDNWDQRIEQIVKKAPEWDIGFIVGIPSWLQLMMERIIDHYQLDTIHDIWPNLKVCVHGGVHFEPYRKGFEQLMAQPLTYVDSYLASEGFIAFQDRPETNAMKLLVNNGIFFEFIPFNDDNFDEEGNIKGSPKVLSIEEVVENENYALLLSTCSGAWRYLIGDTVRFTDVSRSEIVITGRTKHYLSICGEHLSIDNMNQGIQAVEEQLGLNVREFTVSAVEAGTSFTHKWYIGTEEPADEARVSAILDEKLKEVNADYETERSSVLKNIQVSVIPTRIFYDWHRKKGKMGGQNKFPRVMKGQKFREWEQFVQQQLTDTAKW